MKRRTSLYQVGYVIVDWWMQLDGDDSAYVQSQTLHTHESDAWKAHKLNHSGEDDDNYEQLKRRGYYYCVPVYVRRNRKGVPLKRGEQ